MEAGVSLNPGSGPFPLPGCLPQMTVPIVKGEGWERRLQRCPLPPRGPALLWPKVKLLGEAWRLIQGASSIPRWPHRQHNQPISKSPRAQRHLSDKLSGVQGGPEVAGEARVWPGQGGLKAWIHL